MDSGSIERLLLKRGETVTDGHIRALEALVSRQGKMSGRGVRRRVLPWGTIESYRGTGGEGFVSPIFRPSVTKAGDGFVISWERGLIDGIEPTIDDVPISRRDSETGTVPTFTVPASAFGELGEALVYFRCVIGEDWFVQKVVPFAAPETPKNAAWQADKLALILFPDGTWWRALHANQGHMAVNRRTSGLAQHIFWSKH